LEFEYKGKNYKTLYFPFFRIKRLEGYQIFGLRYPSGKIERVFIIDDANILETLKDYLKFLIDEYILEDDEILTPYAKKLKEDIYELFGKRR
jgi:hypothetical protein